MVQIMIAHICKLKINFEKPVMSVYHNQDTCIALNATPNDDGAASERNYFPGSQGGSQHASHRAWVSSVATLSTPMAISGLRHGWVVQEFCVVFAVTIVNAGWGRKLLASHYVWYSLANIVVHASYNLLWGMKTQKPCRRMNYSDVNKTNVCQRRTLAEIEVDMWLWQMYTWARCKTKVRFNAGSKVAGHGLCWGSTQDLC